MFLYLGAIFKIPADALEHPEVFNIQVYDNGEQFPMIDVYPYIFLKKNASLVATPIKRINSQERGRQIPVVPPPASEWNNPAFNKTSPTAPVERNFNRTGVLKSSHFKQQSSLSSRDSMALAQASSFTCSDYLNMPENMQLIKDAAVSVGVVYVDWCLDIPPYVHIMYVNARDARPKLNLNFETAIDPSRGKDGTVLKRLYNHVPDYVGMNGFYWSGDSGAYPGFGYPEGYVFGRGRVLGDNREGGGSGGGSGLPRDNKIFLMFGPNSTQYRQSGEASTVSVLFPTEGTYISSSTSILKWSGCSTDTASDRWSAIGVSMDTTILVSSTSTGTTSAAELCALFQSFRSTLALRLDGGGAAAMTSGGAHLNPLAGINRMYYGIARYISYGLAVTW